MFLDNRERQNTPAFNEAMENRIALNRALMSSRGVSEGLKDFSRFAEGDAPAGSKVHQKLQIFWFR